VGLTLYHSYSFLPKHFGARDKGRSRVNSRIAFVSWKRNGKIKINKTNTETPSMCKTLIGPANDGRLLKKLPAATRVIVFGLLCSLSVTDGPAQCFRCPAEATAAASASSFAIFVDRNGVFVNVSGATVGACETLILTTTAAYQPDGGRDPLGVQQIGAAYAGGRGRVVLPNGSIVDVTPADLAATIIGPTAP
jgi:hypothetical protein